MMLRLKQSQELLQKWVLIQQPLQQQVRQLVVIQQQAQH